MLTDLKVCPMQSENHILPLLVAQRASDYIGGLPIDLCVPQFVYLLDFPPCNTILLYIMNSSSLSWFFLLNSLIIVWLKNFEIEDT